MDLYFVKYDFDKFQQVQKHMFAPVIILQGVQVHRHARMLYTSVYNRRRCRSRMLATGAWSCVDGQGIFNIPMTCKTQKLQLHSLQPTWTVSRLIGRQHGHIPQYQVTYEHDIKFRQTYSVENLSPSALNAAYIIHIPRVIKVTSLTRNRSGPWHVIGYSPNVVLSSRPFLCF